MVRLMLLGLGERGLLARFEGVLVGRTKARTHRQERSGEERKRYRRRIRETVLEIVTEYNEAAPVVFNVDFGHTGPIVPVPVGGMVTIDPGAERIVSE